MLPAIPYHNQQDYNNNNNSNNSYNNHNETTFTTAIIPDSTSKEIVSNKSTVIQPKQQQQQQQQQQSDKIISSTFLGNATIITAATTTTTTTTSISLSSPPSTHSAHSDIRKAITSTAVHRNDHKNGAPKSDDSMSDVIGDESSNYSSESESIESSDLGQQTTHERQPSNTYTSTTYYGSGFGVFHQQNVRSNGGGIALISGSSSSSGLGGGSYSNGINNNVNFLLGGAMLTLITTILCVVCYCCHRNIKKRTEAAYRQQRQWLENEPNMEIYSVEQCYETSGLFMGDSMDGLANIAALHHEPPPSYDAVVAMQEQQQLLMQQQQQQILMQQQLLQQQLSTNSSPPPGYRSSLDVSSMIQQQDRGNGLGGVLTVGGSIVSGMEISSLASSSVHLRTGTSISPIDPILNYNDANGNVALTVPATTVTPTNHRTATCYLRNKQQQQQQRNAAAGNQMSQLNMKKVLQAQSCCSLQRAEVENMWNAAAAALAARSAHLPNESRASTTAGLTISPTLTMNTRKQSQGCRTPTSNGPETFGTRYLRQNYYRRGCPLCGKFRYDNDSALSISMESNLDTLDGTLTEEAIAAGQNNNLETTPNNVNNNESLRNNLNNKEFAEEEFDNIRTSVSGDEEDDNEGNEVEQQCSCLNSKRKNEISSTPPLLSYQNFNTEQGLNRTEELQTMETTESAPTTPDDNANSSLVAARQSTNQAASNNNNEDGAMNLASTFAARDTVTTIPSSPTTAVTTSSSTSTPSATAINLDCINENGIITLDMSKIIDKTGLPTYDAALKLESSGYV